MTLPNNHPLSLFIFVTNKFNSLRLLKILVIMLVIFGVLVKEKTTANTTASKNLETPHVGADDAVLAINSIGGNYFNRNQIKFDTLHRRADDTSDNDLFSLSVENCSRTCGADATTLATKNKSANRAKIAKIQQATVLANTHTITNTVSNVNKNLSSSLASSSMSLLLQHERLLSRPKRYLSFPEGSSFSVAVCFTVGIIGNPRYNYMSFGLNWGVAYDLPNTSWILNHLHGFAKQPIPVAVWHRRSRRSLYKEIEQVVDNMGYNGRDCVLRALCESRQYFQKTKVGMIGEMLRAIFSLPKQRIFSRELAESNDIGVYDKAYRKARSTNDCSEQYDCGFSLLELAFGRYSTPAQGYYTKF